jgi:hypothetical protein
MVMSRGVPNAEKFAAYSKKMTIVAELIPVADLIYEILITYLRGRKVIGVT